MNKFEFMDVIQKCFDECNDEQLEIATKEMIETIRKMYQVESIYRKHVANKE